MDDLTLKDLMAIGECRLLEDEKAIRAAQAEKEAKIKAAWDELFEKVRSQLHPAVRQFLTTNSHGFPIHDYPRIGQVGFSLAIAGWEKIWISFKGEREPWTVSSYTIYSDYGIKWETTKWETNDLTRALAKAKAIAESTDSPF